MKGRLYLRPADVEALARRFTVRELAREMGVSPQVVVGMLYHQRVKRAMRSP